MTVIFVLWIKCWYEHLLWTVLWVWAFSTYFSRIMLWCDCTSIWKQPWDLLPSSSMLSGCTQSWRWSAIFNLRSWKWRIQSKPNPSQVDQQQFQPLLPGKLLGMQREKTHKCLKTGVWIKNKWRGCMVKSPGESHYYTNATKHSRLEFAKQHRPDSKTSGTKSSEWWD